MDTAAILGCVLRTAHPSILPPKSIEDQRFHKSFNLGLQPLEGEELLFEFQLQAGQAKIIHRLLEQDVIEVGRLAELGDQEDDGVSTCTLDLLHQPITARMRRVM